MQPCDRADQVQAETQARGVSYLVRPVKAPQDGIALVFTDAGTGILDAQDGFAVTGKQFDLHLAASRRKFDGVVDEVGDRLDQQVPVTMHAYFVWRVDQEINTFVFRYRLVHRSHLPPRVSKDQLCQTRPTLGVLVFRKPQKNGEE